MQSGVGLEPEEELNATTFQTYLYLVKLGKPAGPRDVMRGANLSSPSVAYRNLQKLTDLGLVVKDSYGNYVVVAHGGGIATLYAHLYAFRCKKGESVRRGQSNPIVLHGNDDIIAVDIA